MSKLVNFSRMIVAMLFLFLAPVALASNIQGDTVTGPKVLAQATPQPGQEEPVVDDDTKGSDVDVNVEAGEDTTGATDNEVMQTEAVTDTNTLTTGVTVDVDPNAEDALGTTATDADQMAGDEPAATMDQADTAQQDDVLLPQTGGVASPWPSYLLIAAGAVFVLGGLAGLAFARRSR